MLRTFTSTAAQSSAGSSLITALTVPFWVLDDDVVEVDVELIPELPPHADRISKQPANSALQIKPTLFPLISPHI